MAVVRHARVSLNATNAQPHRKVLTSLILQTRHHAETAPLSVRAVRTMEQESVMIIVVMTALQLIQLITHVNRAHLDVTPVRSLALVSVTFATQGRD